MRMLHIFLCFLMMSAAYPVKSQDIPGSSIVSRTFLSSDGLTKLVRRSYDNGLGDIVQEILSFGGSTLPSVVVRHEYDEYRRKTRTWLPVISSDSVHASGDAIACIAGTQYEDTAEPES